MGDEKHRHAKIPLQLGEQLKNLRLDRYIKGRGRFIRDQKLWPICQRHCNHHTLTLPTGQLVRIARQSAFRVVDTNTLQQFNHAGARCNAAQALVQLN